MMSASSTPRSAERQSQWRAGDGFIVGHPLSNSPVMLLTKWSRKQAGRARASHMTQDGAARSCVGKQLTVALLIIDQFLGQQHQQGFVPILVCG
jgi:hypothetical protein